MVARYFFRLIGTVAGNAGARRVRRKLQRRIKCRLVETKYRPCLLHPGRGGLHSRAGSTSLLFELVEHWICVNLPPFPAYGLIVWRCLLPRAGLDEGGGKLGFGTDVVGA